MTAPRILVWPWHGRLYENRLILPNGQSRAHPMPEDHSRAVSNPGDTHLIRVAGVPPITPEEAAQAPEGGQFWAGRALLSGTDLYGKRLNGWIYQAKSGSNWWLRLENLSVGASSTTGRFRIRRFGVAGGDPGEFFQYFTLPYGASSLSERSKVGVDLRAANSDRLQLHAVSATGRHAVLALTAANNIAQRPLDQRPRAYRYYLASVTGEGQELLVAITPLYGAADIAPEPITTRPPGYVTLRFTQAPTEISRVPYEQNGQLAGYDVTYSLDSPGSLEPYAWTTEYTTPGTYTGLYRRMLSVDFDGETPVPVWAQVSYTCEVEAPAFTQATIEPRVLRERFASIGYDEVLVAGRYRSTGGGAVHSQINVTVGAWSMSLQMEAASELDTGILRYAVDSWPTTPVTNTYTLTSALGGHSYAEARRPEGMLPDLGAGLRHDGATRQPLISIYHGRTIILLDLYSNNLVGVCAQVADGPLVHVGAATRLTFQSMAGESTPSTASYGSYNPVTGQAVIGALNPVNWI
ncbi:hypothetical protein RAL92_10955 [Metapseudomonas otitidis]|uniref:hypothetical protein n=2 Tax=Metapseudomonas otitidis TaxID=319939 RepID=UPI003216F7E0